MAGLDKAVKATLVGMGSAALTAANVRRPESPAKDNEVLKNE